MEIDSDAEDEDRAIYNPLKLPLGWDGKPIPYWLYKLHGLGKEFKCMLYLSLYQTTTPRPGSSSTDCAPTKLLHNN